MPRSVPTRPSPRVMAPGPSRPLHVQPFHRLLAVGGLALAVAGTVLALVEAYDVGAVVSVLGVGVGGWSQMVSDTRAERFESVAGLVVAALALAVCLANGSGIWT